MNDSMAALRSLSNFHEERERCRPSGQAPVEFRGRRKPFSEKHSIAILWQQAANAKAPSQNNIVWWRPANLSRQGDARVAGGAHSRLSPPRLSPPSSSFLLQKKQIVSERRMFVPPSTLPPRWGADTLDDEEGGRRSSSRMISLFWGKEVPRAWTSFLHKGLPSPHHDGLPPPHSVPSLEEQPQKSHPLPPRC